MDDQWTSVEKRRNIAGYMDTISIAQKILYCPHIEHCGYRSELRESSIVRAWFKSNSNTP
jgi:hypothetical protein